MSARTLLRWLGVACASAAINVVVFGVSDLLSRERPAPRHTTVPVGVQLVTLPPPQAPPPERDPPPPPPAEPPPRLDFSPELAPPVPAAPDLPAVAVAPPPLHAPAALRPGDLVFQAGDLDQPPRARLRTPPPYPFRARQRRVSGSVRVKLLVHADGSVSDVEILSADPPGYFEDAVRRAVPAWRFEPGRIAGEPVDSWVVTTVRFDMEDDG